MKNSLKRIPAVLFLIVSSLLVLGASPLSGGGSVKITAIDKGTYSIYVNGVETKVEGIVIDAGYVHGIKKGTTGRIVAKLAGVVETPVAEFVVKDVSGETSLIQITRMMAKKLPEGDGWTAEFDNLASVISATPLSDDFADFNRSVWHKSGDTIGDTIFPGKYYSGEGNSKKYVKADNGELVLSFSEVPGDFPAQNNPGGKRYVGGSVFTDSVYSYGYYETNIYVPSKKGIVVGFFLFSMNRHSNMQSDEIDIEIFTSLTSGDLSYCDRADRNRSPRYSQSLPRAEILFSTWNDWSRKGGYSNPFCLGDNHWAGFLERGGFDPTDFYHTYGYDWTPDYVDFYIDGERVKRIDKAVPQPPLGIMFNVWASDKAPETGYPPNLEPGEKIDIRISDIRYTPKAYKTRPFKGGTEEAAAPEAVVEPKTGAKTPGGVDISTILRDSNKGPGVDITGGSIFTSSTVLLIDVSSSMKDGNKIKEAAKAALEYINDIGPKERIALLTFNTSTYMIQNFTGKKGELVKSFEKIRIGGRTALFDALNNSMKLLDSPQGGRKTVVVITDGLDNSSRTTIKQLHFTSMKLGVEIVTIGIGGSNKNLNALKSLSKTPGKGGGDQSDKLLDSILGK